MRNNFKAITAMFLAVMFVLQAFIFMPQAMAEGTATVTYDVNGTVTTEEVAIGEMPQQIPELENEKSVYAWIIYQGWLDEANNSIDPAQTVIESDRTFTAKVVDKTELYQMTRKYANAVDPKASLYALNPEILVDPYNYMVEVLENDNASAMDAEAAIALFNETLGRLELGSQFYVRGLADGKVMQQPEFTLEVRQDGKLVKRYKTADMRYISGNYRSDILPNGQYTVHVKSAPEGYFLEEPDKIYDLNINVTDAFSYSVRMIDVKFRTPRTFTVNYDLNEGTANVAVEDLTQQVIEGEKFQPHKPFRIELERKGYVFDNWYTADDEQISWLKEHKPEGDMTLIAKWAATMGELTVRHADDNNSDKLPEPVLTTPDGSVTYPLTSTQYSSKNRTWKTGKNIIPNGEYILKFNGLEAKQAIRMETETELATNEFEYLGAYMEPGGELNAESKVGREFKIRLKFSDNASSANRFVRVDTTTEDLFTVTYDVNGKITTEEVAAGQTPANVPVLKDEKYLKKWIVYKGWADEDANDIVPAETVIDRDRTFTAKFIDKTELRRLTDKYRNVDHPAFIMNATNYDILVEPLQEMRGVLFDDNATQEEVDAAIAAFNAKLPELELGTYFVIAPQDENDKTIKDAEFVVEIRQDGELVKRYDTADIRRNGDHTYNTPDVFANGEYTLHVITPPKGYFEQTEGEVYNVKIEAKTLFTGPIRIYRLKFRQAEEYTVTYDLNGGTASMTAEELTQQVVEGETFRPHAPFRIGLAREGYVFQDWYTEEDERVSWMYDQTAEGNLRLIAKWEETKGDFQVRHSDDNNGDKLPEPVLKSLDGTVTYPLTSNSYGSSGRLWKTGRNIVPNGEYILAFNGLEDGMMIRVNTEASHNTNEFEYLGAYREAGGELLADSKVGIEFKVRVKFDDDKTAGNRFVRVETATEELLTVTYDINGKEKTEQVVTGEKPANVPVLKDKKGLNKFIIYKGWADEDGNDVDPAETVIDKDREFTAKYVDKTAVKKLAHAYRNVDNPKIRLNATNYEILIDPLNKLREVLDNDDATQEEVDAAEAAFRAALEELELGTYFTISPQDENKKIIRDAHFIVELRQGDKVIKRYDTAEIEPNGSGSYNTPDIIPNGSYTLHVITNPEGYLMQKPGKVYDVEIAATSLLAGSKPIVKIKFRLAEIYTITYDLNGGTAEVADLTQTVRETESFKPHAPFAINLVREGYVFDDWYTEGGERVSWMYEQTPTGDMHLIAKWEETKGKLQVVSAVNDHSDKKPEPVLSTPDGETVYRFASDSYTNIGRHWETEKNLLPNGEYILSFEGLEEKQLVRMLTEDIAGKNRFEYIGAYADDDSELDRDARVGRKFRVKLTFNDELSASNRFVRIRTEVLDPITVDFRHERELDEVVGLPEAITAYKGIPVELPKPDSFKTKYWTFKGWYLESDPETIYQPGMTVEVTEDTTFVAAWTANAMRKVIFHTEMWPNRPTEEPFVLDIPANQAIRVYNILRGDYGAIPAEPTEAEGDKLFWDGRYYLDEACENKVTSMTRVSVSADDVHIYYCFKPAPLQGWHVIGGEVYYFVDGEPLTGLQKIGKTTYLFDADGKQQRGWHVVGGKSMYFNEKNGGRWTGKRTIGNTTYLLGSDGGKLCGWHLLGGKKYYFDPDFGCGMVTGLRTAGSKAKYYFRITESAAGAKDRGSAVVDTEMVINGKIHVFNANGVLISVRSE